jgi:glycosyltransferase involved in cell wall biosynthesis
MRILHLIHSEGVYGAESILLYLAREQQQCGHEAIIGSMRDPGTAETQFEALARLHQLPVVPIRIAPRPTPGVIAALMHTIRPLAADVLHSHGYKANILLAPLSRRRRGAMLATLHGWTNTRGLNRMWLYERLDRLALRRLECVVVVTRAMLDLPALRGVDATRRRVIENGIPPLATRLNDLAARGAAPLPAQLVEFTTRRPTLVAIGRLSAEKGFMLLVEAFARARSQSTTGHQLLIVGEGPERERLARRIAELGISEAVCLGGYVDAADRLLAHAAAFVMSSVTEGMPLVLLEAMQWRVPVVATAVGAIPAMLNEGRHGRLVAPNDLRSLTQALLEVMSADTDLQPAIAAAHAAVSGHFTSARMAAEYGNAYGAIA